MILENHNNKLFALVDCNNFYASCERSFQPHLEGRPVVVLSNNDGCAIARSDEAKALGIKMGAPLFKFKHLINKHRIVVLSSNYALYGDLSARVIDIITQNMPAVLVYSIDEAFLDLTSLQKNFDIQQMCQELVVKIRKATGIPVSIGIGATKTIAKVANFVVKRTKTTSVGYLSPRDLDLVLSNMKLSDVWGIGRRYEDKLNALGYYTALELKNASVESIQKKFNITLARTVAELKGLNTIDLDGLNATRKQIVVSRSFGELVTAFTDLKSALAEHVVRAAEKLRAQCSLVTGIVIFLQTNAFRTHDLQYRNSCYVEMPAPTNDTRILLQYATQGLQSIYKSGFRYKKIGVMLNDISSASNKQFDLFADTNNKHSEKLMEIMDSINLSFGKASIKFGLQCADKPWQMKSSHRSLDFVTNWKQLPIAIAK